MKLLIVTYYFPPVGGVGVQRVLKWVKYLPEFGIEPVILTNEHGLGYIQDESLLNLEYLKKIKIYRTGGKKLKKYHTHKKQGKIYSFHNFLLLFRYVWSLDIYSSWFDEIKKHIPEIIRNEQIDCILTTSPPHSTHLFGYYSKRKLSIPWIMDLRDPMVLWPGRTGWLEILLQKLIEPKFEKSFYRSADHVIFVAQYAQKLAHKRCANFPAYKSSLIRNGFDPDDFLGASKFKIDSKDKFCITYTGTIFNYQNPQPFCNALTSLTQKRLVEDGRIKILLIGKLIPEKQKIFKDLPKEILVEFVDTVGHAEALQYQKNADLLLLIMSEDYRGYGKDVLPGKVFEYIGSGRPVFALASEGELSDLIRDNKFGYVADPANQDEVEQILLNAYHNWKQGINMVSGENREQYTRKAQCQTLSNIIKEVAAEQKTYFKE